MGLLMGALGGMIAGIVTGILHTKLKIHAILAGILTMTGLYSINLFVMGDKPSIFFYGEKTVFTPFEGKFFYRYNRYRKVDFVVHNCCCFSSRIKVIFNDSGRTFS